MTSYPLQTRLKSFQTSPFHKDTPLPSVPEPSSPAQGLMVPRRVPTALALLSAPLTGRLQLSKRAQGSCEGGSPCSRSAHVPWEFQHPALPGTVELGAQLLEEGGWPVQMSGTAQTNGEAPVTSLFLKGGAEHFREVGSGVNMACGSTDLLPDGPCRDRLHFPADRPKHSRPRAGILGHLPGWG